MLTKLLVYIYIFILFCLMLYCLVVAALTGELLLGALAIAFGGQAVYVLRWILSWRPKKVARETFPEAFD